MSWKGIIEAYRSYLPVTAKTPVVSLWEGNTPLIFSGSLSKATGLEVFLKYEGLNPTGSFKDRGMTMALSKAKEDGAKMVICASTGNTSASAAAYAARAGLKCAVLIPDGHIAFGKLSQALIHNATVIAIRGNFDVALQMVKEVSKSQGIALVNSLNPYRIEGQKTGAFEICDQLGEAPDYHAIPVGNAGNITAYWKGYNEYFDGGKISKRPVMLGFQAMGASPIVQNKIVKNPKTFATAIRIGNPASWQAALKARSDSGGRIDAVTDAEILGAYKWLAAHDGVFVEPASAASVAGMLKLSKQGYFKKQQKKNKQARIVCVLTGHGLKDPDVAVKAAGKLKKVPAQLDAVLKAIRS
jgi:threonine synthase